MELPRTSGLCSGYGAAVAQTNANSCENCMCICYFGQDIELAAVESDASAKTIKKCISSSLFGRSKGRRLRDLELLLR